MIIIVLGVTAQTSGARAGSASADALIGLDTGIGTGVGSHDLLAYSKDPGPPATVNFFKQDSFLGAPPTAVTRFDERISVAVRVLPPVFLFRSFAPPVGFRDRAKPVAGAAFVKSASPAAAGPASGLASYSPPAGALPAGLSARAVAPGAGQEAAAEAVDPIDVPAGHYAYAPFITEATLHLDGLPSEFAGVTFFARDSRFSDPLWMLGIVAVGALTSPSDLQIAFVSQPLLGLDDDAVAAHVRDSFIVAGGTATLTSHTVFSTSYDVSQTIQFSEGLNAGVASVVPEPSSLVLSALGTLVLGGIVARRSLRAA